jgi:hypothetical protein
MCSGNAQEDRGNCPGPEIISQDEMRAMIKAAADEAGNVTVLCRKLKIVAPAPVYLALQRKRAVPDEAAIAFGFIKTTMYRRIGYASRKA